MGIFRAAKVRGLAELIPDDPNEAIVDEIYKSYPFGAEAFGLRSFIRLVVRTVLELKKRGLI